MGLFLRGASPSGVESGDSRADLYRIRFWAVWEPSLNRFSTSAILPTAPDTIYRRTTSWHFADHVEQTWESAQSAPIAPRKFPTRRHPPREGSSKTLRASSVILSAGFPV